MPVTDYRKPKKSYSQGTDYLGTPRDYSKPLQPGADSPDLERLAAMTASAPGLAPVMEEPKPEVAAPTADQTIGSVGGQPVGANPYAGGNDWKSSLSPDEAWIISHESGFRPDARNPSSGAFGIWQGLGSTLSSYTKRNGYDLYTTNPLEQLNMFRQYTADRYGNAANAVAFWKKNGWY